MLKLENITKYYHSSTSVTCALSKINLEFNIGEFVAITGESGSGKTTLLNVISGLDTYEDGELYYNGNPTSYYSMEELENYRKSEIAFIFQNYNLIDSFTVLENVMVPLIIDGMPAKDAKHKANELLDEVGIKKLKNKKATKLSGGERQRVSIARALAKETNIIVADEPTGNLDAENGKMIMELLKKISTNKLVIVVTHNMPQAEPYITRKIRLHDGVVVLDETKEEVRKLTPIENNKHHHNISTAFNFFLLNLKSQPKRTILLFLMIFVNVLATFICFGTFVANLDDNKTKKLSDDIFINHDMTRLIVKETNNKSIDNEILEKAKVKQVSQVEKYDYITDINYFRPEDCSTLYLGGWQDNNESQIFVDNTTFYVKNRDRFMRSASFLKEEDLKEGKLPTSNLEMVVYTDDSSKLNSTETIYFCNPKKWGKDTVITYEIKIVGILKKPTTQAYFSEDICRMLELTNLNLKLQYPYSYVNKYWQVINKAINYNYIMIDYNLTGNEISLSPTYYDGYTTIKNNPDVTLKETNQLNLSIDGINKTYSVIINTETKFESFDEGLGVSPTLFNQIYNELVDKKQFAVYIDDYAYTDEVINALSKSDLQAISCYRSSVIGYDMEKVTVRYITLAISLVGLIVINIVIVLLCYGILKLKKNDYLILKMLGLSNKTNKIINIIEMIFYTIISMLCLIIITTIVSKTTSNTYLIEFFKYIRVYHYIICLGLCLITSLIISYYFNKYIKSKIKITSLKEE
ncbi:MAG: ATP-binding cassette domain-containing protein [Bacilli bacterium]|nr:ATP-binding cassette domain-containing protein [Mollicutes bacterium]MDY3899225.1 ATP-binding cassette domain-containing protein [Bacilli bacterium]